MLWSGRLSVNQLRQDAFLRPMADTVHPGDPSHGIVGFQGFIDAPGSRHLWDHAIQPIPAGFIDFRQMLVQFAGQDQTGIFLVKCDGDFSVPSYKPYSSDSE